MGPCEFIIITLPRSGSYHLTSLLDSAADIVCHGEIFKTDYVELRPFYLNKLKMSVEDTSRRDADRIKFVTDLRSVNPKKIFGFKAFPDHFSHDQLGFDAILKHPRWRKIFLFRHPIESYSSLLRAKSTGIWVLEEKASSLREKLQSKVIFEPDTWTEHLKICNWLEALFTDISTTTESPCYRVDYGSLSNKDELQGILGFLGSQSHAIDLYSKHYRQFSLPTREGFSNWPIFEEYLKSSGRDDLLNSLAGTVERHAVQ